MDDLIFQSSVARRLGGGIQSSTGTACIPTCAHCTPSGPCTVPLDHDGHHAVTCNMGGHPLRRHGRVVRWLAGWLEDGRADSEVRLEQSIVQDPPGWMDVVVSHGESQLRIDVAIVAATSDCQRTLASRFSKDGHAARMEEKVKRRQDGYRVTHFVLEAGGRPGRSARTILMSFACPDKIQRHR